MITAITADVLHTPLHRIPDAVVLVENGRILRLGNRELLALPAQAKVVALHGELTPGLVELHIHGAAGHDVMRDDAAGFARMRRFLAARGVTSFLPTTVSAPRRQLLEALRHLGGTVTRPPGTGARPLGIHLEGPFLSPLKRGVHPLEALELPSPEAFSLYYQASGGTIRLLTIAPELVGALPTIRYARSLGVAVSLGHSNATAAETLAAIEAGATHATHTFNAMRSFDHREPGLVGTVLTDDRLTAEIIADGHHVDRQVVRIFARCKGAARAVLVTDALSATGMADGVYELGGQRVELRGGCCWSGDRLAGSALTLDRAVRRYQEFTGCNFHAALLAATANPAAVLGRRDVGSLRVGVPADLLLWGKTGEVEATYLAGECWATSG